MQEIYRIKAGEEVKLHINSDSNSLEIKKGFKSHSIPLQQVKSVELVGERKRKKVDVGTLAFESFDLAYLDAGFEVGLFNAIEHVSGWLNPQNRMWILKLKCISVQGNLTTYCFIDSYDGKPYINPEPSRAMRKISEFMQRAIS